MSDATVLEVMSALATLLESELAAGVPGIQVDPLLVTSPTPPCIDVYPGDPFGEAITFDNGEEVGREQLFTIRARVSAADQEAGQQLLLGLMDRNGGSVVGAIRSDTTLNGNVDDCVVEGPSGYIAYADAAGGAVGSLLGCEWRLRVLL